MIRTNNLLAFAAAAVLSALCTTGTASAALHNGWGNYGNNNGNNNGCNNGNNGCNNSNHNHGGGGGGNCNPGGLVCDAGGDYVVTWLPGSVTFTVDATGSTGASTYAWSTNLQGAVFADPSAAVTTLTVPTTSCCFVRFDVRLTVGNGQQTRTCEAEVKIKDRTKPVITCPDLAKIICGSDESPESTGTPTVTDDNDANPFVWYSDCRVYPECPAGRFDYVIERTWKAKDNCGNVASCVQKIDVVKVPLMMDAIPGACPNVVNFESCAPVKMAILGSATFNVQNIVPSTVKLYGRDCDGGPVFPLCAYRADVSSPGALDGWSCECVDQNEDGYLDLVFFFKRSRVIQRLGLCDLPSGSSKQISLVGKLCDGCRFIAVDCLRVP